MIRPAGSELLVRGVALYGPIAITIALATYVRPTRARLAGAVLATAWNVPALLALNLIAVKVGWWTFRVHTATVAGIPADLWLGWALLWGAVPLLATTRRHLLAGAVLVAVDLVLMPAALPVLHLDRTWLFGEVIAAATCLTPALLLGRWTADQIHVNRRASLQVVAFSGLLLFVLPSLIFTATGENWGELLSRPRWQFVLAALAAAPAGALALQAVREFAACGGTPVPLDPPPSLVTTGPYAYVANPMQLGATVILAMWGLLLSSPAVIGAAPMAAVFSAGIAAWSENHDLAGRFGPEWIRYRGQVRVWLPRWHPVPDVQGVVYVASSCGPCSEVGAFLVRRRPIGLTVEAAESCKQPLRRITYCRAGRQAAGVAAIGRSLEHVNLPWATASWIARLPAVEQVLQVIVDAVGGDPRTLPTS